MIISNINNGFAFAANPILVANTQDPDPGMSLSGYPFTVLYGGKSVYDGRYSPPLDVNLSEVAMSVSHPYKEMTSNGNIIECIEDLENLEARRMRLVVGDDHDEMECLVMPGGVSRELLAKYHKAGMDAFSARFLNPKVNFFLTTRSSEWVITIKETEIMPLYFISMSPMLYIRIVDPVSSHEWLSEGEWEEGVFALDIETLRKTAFNEYGIIPAVFDIYADNGCIPSARIVITESLPSARRSMVKFRNSLGVMDCMEIIGDMVITPADADDKSKYRIYDALIDGFVEKDQRSALGREISMTNISIDASKMLLALDMLRSDEIYLDDTPVTVEDFEWTMHPHGETPDALTVTFATAYDEDLIMPASADHGKPRLFTNQFVQQFN